MSRAAQTNVKSSHLFLIIGAGLFTAGLVAFGLSTYSIVKEVLQGSALINETAIGPNETTAVVMKNVPEGQRLALALRLDPPGVPLTYHITGPDGKVLPLYGDNSTESRLEASALTTATGDQTLEIKNTGNRSVSVTGALVNIPLAQNVTGSSSLGSPQLQKYVAAGLGILAGIVLVVAGIVMLIIGAVKYFRERGAERAAPSPSK